MMYWLPQGIPHPTFVANLITQNMKHTEQEHSEYIQAQLWKAVYRYIISTNKSRTAP